MFEDRDHKATVSILGMGNIEAFHPFGKIGQIEDPRQAFDGARRLIDVVAVLLPLEALLFKRAAAFSQAMVNSCFSPRAGTLVT